MIKGTSPARINPEFLLVKGSSRLSADRFKALVMPLRPLALGTGLIIRAEDKEISRVQRVAGN